MIYDDTKRSHRILQYVFRVTHIGHLVISLDKLYRKR